MMEAPAQTDNTMYIVAAGGGLLLLNRMRKQRASSPDEKDGVNDGPHMMPGLLAFAAILYAYREDIPHALPIVAATVASNGMLHIGGSYVAASAFAVVAHLVVSSCLKTG